MQITTSRGSRLSIGTQAPDETLQKFRSEIFKRVDRLEVMVERAKSREDLSLAESAIERAHTKGEEQLAELAECAAALGNLKSALAASERLLRGNPSHSDRDLLELLPLSLRDALSVLSTDKHLTKTERTALADRIHESVDVLSSAYDAARTSQRKAVTALKVAVVKKRLHLTIKDVAMIRFHNRKMFDSVDERLVGEIESTSSPRFRDTLTINRGKLLAHREDNEARLAARVDKARAAYERALAEHRGVN